MSTVAASSGDPVKIYYDSLENLHDTVRQNTPFTYLAYKSILLSKEDDFIGVAYKISYYVTFKFFIQMAVHMGAPVCSLIPFFPLCMDVLWVGYRWIQDLTTEGTNKSASAPLTTFFFLSLGLLAFHYLDKFPDY